MSYEKTYSTLKKLIKSANKNYYYFQMNQDKLYRKYKHSFLVIKDCKVISNHKTLSAAEAASKGLPYLSFIIEEINY